MASTGHSLPSSPRAIPHVQAPDHTGYDFWTLAKTGQKLRTNRHL